MWPGAVGAGVTRETVGPGGTEASAGCAVSADATEGGTVGIRGVKLWVDP